MVSTQALIAVTVRWLEIKWGYVKPCAGKTWEECLTYYKGRKALWFNTSDNSTRIHWL